MVRATAQDHTVHIVALSRLQHCSVATNVDGFIICSLGMHAFTSHGFVSVCPDTNGCEVSRSPSGRVISTSEPLLHQFMSNVSGDPPTPVLFVVTRTPNSLLRSHHHHLPKDTPISSTLPQILAHVTPMSLRPARPRALPIRNLLATS